MRRTSPRPINKAVVRLTAPTRRGKHAAFTLIEAVVTLVVTAFLAGAAAMIATSALERERRARLDADAAGAVRALTVRLIDSPEPPQPSYEVQGGWRAVRQVEPDPQSEWQSWAMYAPSSDTPYQVLVLPKIHSVPSLQVK